RPARDRSGPAVAENPREVVALGARAFPWGASSKRGAFAEGAEGRRSDPSRGRRASTDAEVDASLHPRAQGGSPAGAEGATPAGAERVDFAALELPLGPEARHLGGAEAHSHPAILVLGEGAGDERAGLAALLVHDEGGAAELGTEARTEGEGTRPERRARPSLSSSLRAAWQNRLVGESGGRAACRPAAFCLETCCPRDEPCTTMGWGDAQRATGRCAAWRRRKMRKATAHPRRTM